MAFHLIAASADLHIPELVDIPQIALLDYSLIAFSVFFKTMRVLKHHEQRLLKKVDLIQFPKEHSNESHVIHTYHLPSRSHYLTYNKLVGKMHSLATKISLLKESDPVRIKFTKLLVDKAFDLGITKSKSFAAIIKVTVSAFCRRRIAVVLCRLKMSENLTLAVKLVEQVKKKVTQGHIRIGPNIITDPAFLITRQMEDYVTWADSSKIKQKILKYNDLFDDFEMAA